MKALFDIARRQKVDDIKLILVGSTRMLAVPCHYYDILGGDKMAASRFLLMYKL